MGTLLAAAVGADEEVWLPWLVPIMLNLQAG